MARRAHGSASVSTAPLGADGVVALPLAAARGGAGTQDQRDRQVREWLWLLLRFAITRDPQDELAAMVMAGRIDWLAASSSAHSAAMRQFYL